MPRLSEATLKELKDGIKARKDKIFDQAHEIQLFGLREDRPDLVRSTTAIRRMADEVLRMIQRVEVLESRESRGPESSSEPKTSRA